jgi:hypothetical protein
MNLHGAASPGCGAVQHRHRNVSQIFMPPAYNYVNQFIMIYFRLVSTSVAAKHYACIRAG